MSEPREQEMTLRDYANVIARRRWIVIVPVVAAVAAALGVASLQEPIYEARSQMLVKTRNTSTVFDNGSSNIGDPVRAIQNEIQVLEGEPVRQRVAADLALTAEPPQASGATMGSTDVVGVTVRSGDPTTARVLADAYIQAYIEVKREQAVEGLVSAGAELQRKVTELQDQINTLDQQATAPDAAQSDIDAQRRVLVDQQSLFKQRLDQLQVEAALATGGADVVRSADQPVDPVEPKPLRAATLALVVGLLIGLGAAFLLDYVDDSIRTPDELERAADGLPVLAVVPTDPPPDHLPIALSRPGDTAVEAYRGLRTGLQFLSIDRATRIIQVTSPLSGDGKTTVATNLAVVFSQAGLRVLLVDADLRRPRVHKVFDIDPAYGLTNALIGEPLGLLTHSVAPDLDVLPSGPIPPNPSELLGGVQMRSFLERLGDYDLVIFDSAPALPVTDSVALSTAVDGVVVVTQSGKTSNKQLQMTLSQLQRVQAPVLGTVLNKASNRRSRRGAGSSYGYGYGYGYGAHTDDAKPKPSFGKRFDRKPAAPAERNGHGASTIDETTTPAAGSSLPEADALPFDSGFDPAAAPSESPSD